MAGRSALKLKIGYCVPWLAILFQRGKRAACFSLAKLWHSCCCWASAHQSYFPLFQHIAINYPPTSSVHLTADRPTMHRKFWRISSFMELWAMKRIRSLHFRKELRFANFPFVSFYILSFYKKTFRFILVKQHVLQGLKNPTWILAEQGQSLVLAGY